MTGGSPLPENLEVGWRQLDEVKSQDAIQMMTDMLAMVNDVLSAKESNIYFGMIPSTQNGIEIAWFERGKE
jgi:hypothetical protein